MDGKWTQLGRLGSDRDFCGLKDHGTWAGITGLGRNEWRRDKACSTAEGWTVKDKVIRPQSLKGISNRGEEEGWHGD